MAAYSSKDDKELGSAANDFEITQQIVDNLQKTIDFGTLKLQEDLVPEKLFYYLIDHGTDGTPCNQDTCITI